MNYYHQIFESLYNMIQKSYLTKIKFVIIIFIVIKILQIVIEIRIRMHI